MAETYEAWLKAHPAPNLVELVARYGTYEAVPVEAWTQFGDAQIAWEKRRNARTAQERKPKN